MAKSILEKLATMLSKTSTIAELHGFGILFAGGYSKRIPNAPATNAEKQRPDADSLAAVIVELNSRGCTKKVKGELLQDRLMENLRHFTVQANNAIKRAKLAKEKAAKADAKKTA